MRAKGKRIVRVLAGSLKGSKLVYPAGPGQRPTLQRTKASVFDSIGEAIRGAIFLDLFAAAGGIGIEAASRGARLVHFVERNRDALRLLRANLDTCGLVGGRCAIHEKEVLHFLEKGGLRGTGANIVYADPPYGRGCAGDLMEVLDENDHGCLRLFILEHQKGLQLEGFGRFRRVRVRKFGQTWVSFFYPTGGEEP